MAEARSRSEAGPGTVAAFAKSNEMTALATALSGGFAQKLSPLRSSVTEWAVNDRSLASMPVTNPVVVRLTPTTSPSELSRLPKVRRPALPRVRVLWGGLRTRR